MHTHTVKIEVIYFSIGIRAWYTMFRFISRSVILLSSTLFLYISKIVPAFDGTNYDYWKSRMRFFLKSIDC
jgi:hypothetical protein